MVQATDADVAVPAPGSTTPRLDGVDLLRGLVMALMVLDHTRDYFGEASFDPTDLSRATPALFLTRWVTHFCAPTFALLAGVGARLAGARGMSPGALSLFLLTRGLWLIVLEQTVVKLGLSFLPDPGFFLALVFWSLGGSFVLLSACVAARVPARVVGVVGMTLIATLNLLDGLSPDAAGPVRPLVVLLLKPGIIRGPGGVSLLVGYPLLPWFGVVAAGYGLGGIFGLEPGRRRASLTAAGAAAVVLFAALRARDGYGDPRPWSAGKDALTTALSFMNCTKNPPSLLFLLMTLGPALLGLAAFDRGVGPLGRPLVTLGRVPLFLFVLQWYIIHTLALLVAVGRGGSVGWLFASPVPVPPRAFAFPLPAVYGWWLVVLAIQYGPCAWFAGVKRRHREWRWLSYL
jgi:uncharacterized membrane protein